MSLILRGKTFHLCKRVPKRFEGIEPRKAIWISLHTDSEKVAKSKAPAAWSEMVEAWEAKLAGRGSEAEACFEAAKQLAQARSFRYLPVDRVASLPLAELLDRVDAVQVVAGKPDKTAAAAFLGGAKPPTFTVQQAVDLYWDLSKDKTLGKSADQLRRWRNPLLKAVKNFVGVVGDKAIAEITGDDMLDFRSWWVDRVEEEGLSPDSANKEFVHLGVVLKTVNRLKRLGLVFPLSDLALKKGEKGLRPPFSDAWIKERLLKPGALAGLNSEAQCILLGMVNTGYRPSEGAALKRDQIRLDGPIPHISIEPIDRQLKNSHSRRVIPLAGVSLDAFRECPAGFPRYADNASLSATVNKFLRENNLVETPKHTMYSLRHSFEDRMIAANVDDRLRRDLFGHTLTRERYGLGASLEHKYKIVQHLAF